MKKSLFALAVLGAFAGAAQAQSSVTLYGTFDASIANVSNTGAGASITGMANSLIENNSWGLKGSEDLGGGMKAHFNLESAFSVTNGQGPGTGGDASSLGNANGELFGRAANVGIGGGFGDVTVGRMLNPYIIAAFGGQSNGANSFVVNSLGASLATMGYGLGNVNFFVSNAVQYTLPKFADISITAFYGFGNNNSNNSSAGNTTAVSAEWSSNGIALGGAYQKLTADAPGGTSYGSTGWTAHQPDEVDYQVFAKYTTGPFSIGANFMNNKVTVAGVDTSANMIVASAGYQVNPNTNLSLGYSTVNSGSKWNLIGKYSLSKRTYLYGMVDTVSNSSTSTYTNFWDGTLGSSSAVTSGTSTGIAAGLVTHF
jgi:predicted porin